MGNVQTFTKYSKSILAFIGLRILDGSEWIAVDAGIFLGALAEFLFALTPQQI